jgi:ribonucleotide monophosphatase NagD (HAD superfamily)
VAGIAVAAGVTPEVAGKPYAATVALLQASLGESLAETVMVGDRPDTDGRLAGALGCRFALVLTGVTRPDQADRVQPRPALVQPDLAAVARTLVP